MRLRQLALFVTVLSMGVGGLQGTAKASSESPAAVVADAYEQWQAALGVREQCASGVSIVLETLPGRRGEYRPATHQVVIDPDGDVDGMAGVATHELAHHAFLSCGVFAEADFTAAFYAAQSLPEDRDWLDYSAGWTQTPAEHFAEAMALVIAGNGEGGIEVTPEAVGVLSRWLAGAPIVPPETQNPEAYAEHASPAATGSNSDVDQVGDMPAPLRIAPIASAKQPRTGGADSNSASVPDQPAVDVSPLALCGPYSRILDVMSTNSLTRYWLRSTAQLRRWLER